VVEIRVNEGSIVQAGTSLLSLEPTSAELQAVLYLPPADGKDIQPGMSVQISPSNVPRQQYGVLLGKVASVGAYPATYDGMLAVLGNEELARMLSVDGAPIEIRVELIKASTPSGYQWSSPQGPAFQVQSGTFCTANITISTEAPISLVLGGSR
jgi:HlyD family secretion protein